MIFHFNEFNFSTMLLFILICKIPKLFHYPYNCHNPLTLNLSRFQHSRVFLTMLSIANIIRCQQKTNKY